MKYVLDLLEVTSKDSTMHPCPGQDQLCLNWCALLFFETLLLVQT